MNKKLIIPLVLGLLASYAACGGKLDVSDFGAVPNDRNFDNSAAFQEAMDAAEEGNVIYVPEGDWYFTESAFRGKSYTAHIALKAGVTLKGAGQEKTRLISRFEEGRNRREKTSVILLRTISDAEVSDLTVTSDTDDSQLPDPNDSKSNTFVGTAPVYGIVIDNDRPIESHGSIDISRVTVEKFQRMGIRIRVVHDVTVEECTLQKATDLGGGGAGYGISIQGMSNGSDLTGSNLDTYNNRVIDCVVNGPHIRHGILIQYFAHDNLIKGNTLRDTLLDSIDLHGEDEYANEISHNTIINPRAGAAIGLGNSGATHDATGPDNYIHDNTIEGGSRGIDVQYGTPRSRIENNVIRGVEKWGILLQNAPDTMVSDNRIENIAGPEGTGVKILYSYNALEPEQGVPVGVQIKDNHFENVTKGIYAEVLGKGCLVENNSYQGDFDSEFEDGTSSFELPPISDIIIPRTGTFTLPIHDNFITNESPARIQTQSNMRFKASYFDVPYNRMIYMMFDLSEGPEQYDGVYLKLSGKSKDGLAKVNIYGSTSYTNWHEGSLTWENALYHEKDVAIVSDPGSELDLAGDFTFTAAGQSFNTYYVDLTDYIKSLEATRVTLILANQDVQNMYCEFYSKESSTEKYRPGLVYTRN